ncbi:(Fe-S)-binding protein [Candidatus Bathyarchaeota archaeon]|nr:(Fe-S)-binding protein [Candidatus Bathyarchaeota archaeon]
MVIRIRDIDPAFATQILPLGVKACSQCAACTGSCPVALTGPLRIRKLMRQAQFGLRDKILQSDVLWTCTMCNECFERCPKAVDIPKVILTLRNLAVERGLAPKAVMQAESSVMNLRNLFGANPSIREFRLKKLTKFYPQMIQAKIDEKADIVYWVGCIASYFGRIQGVPYAIASILNHVGENWTLLNEEWCCGRPLALSGVIGDYAKIAEHNVRVVEALGVRRLVTGCPGCMLAFKNDYPKILNRELNFEVIHFTQLLDQYVSKGMLASKKLVGRVVYHDPCELGRLGGIFKEPRNILERFVTRVVESKENLRNSRCCGAGGFVRGINSSLAESLALARLKTLLETDAELIVTACPGCEQNLKDAALKQKVGVQVLDVAELVARQLGLL